MKVITTIAASIAILLSVFYIVNSKITQEAGFGEKLAMKLPDNSEVILNAKSSIS